MVEAAVGVGWLYHMCLYHMCLYHIVSVSYVSVCRSRGLWVFSRQQ
jgi:hypothetical protein